MECILKNGKRRFYILALDYNVLVFYVIWHWDCSWLVDCLVVRWKIEVVYEGAMFKLVRKGRYEFLGVVGSYCNSFEIIGNKFENPELLK